jgi:DNA mismatch endonuclease (patch repair protein)
MAAIRRTDTVPERELRSVLHRRGLRFRKDFAIVVGGKRTRPDIVFTRVKVAVFVDGCFWHCCPQHGRRPSKNTGYWSPKLRRNVERDREQTVLLERAGWAVARFWEHEAVHESADTVATLVAARAKPATA